MRDLENFDAIQISIASPEEIFSWSHGEVKKPETINYRTHKPERDGLFCEKTFGPTKDWECFCGKFRSIRYKGVVCERCGVEVTRSKVRRERMGHIKLAAPVAHIWFVKGTFSYIALLLDISPRDLEKIIYFNSYVVIDPGNLPLMEKQLLSEIDYRKYRKKYGDLFDARMGAEAVKILLQHLDVVKLVADLKSKLNEKSGAKKQNIIKRLQVTEMFQSSISKPEWMIMEVIPVIPPDLRPMVQLDGGRFATSDLNDLYRRVINRNNRLKRLLDLEAPEIIIKNEKRMLQEAVNSLIDNGRRGRPVTGTGKRPLKSLNDMLTGKQGRFRENLLGKRVDYSGRSVIVVGPSLKLHQCGLPKKMALELFKPFIMNKLVARGVVNNIKAAKKLLERNKPEVMDILEEVIKDHPVLLNRAPTLHRLGIQAFEPILTEGKAIQIHPLVCTAFNADFDGDQMAVHIPLLTEAQVEARILMMSTNNLFSPANGKPIAVPTQDMAIGCYYLTRAYDTTRTRIVAPVLEGRKIIETIEEQVLGKCVKFCIGEKIVDTRTGEIIASAGDEIDSELLAAIKAAKVDRLTILDECVFRDPQEAIVAYDAKSKSVTLHEKVWIRIPKWKLILKDSPANIEWLREKSGRRVPKWRKVNPSDPVDVNIFEEVFYKISIGRLILNDKLPPQIGLIDQLMDKGRLAGLIEKVYNATNNITTCKMLDDMKQLGFKYATISGTSISASDLLKPKTKDAIIFAARKKVEEQEERFFKHQINREEKRQADINIWQQATNEVTDAMLQNFKELDRRNVFNPVYLMAISGARGNIDQIRQLAGMRGLMSNPHGDVIDFPITSNFRDGLTVPEYFISTFGARKGLVDTALRTADSGYLTRRLVDVAQDVIVREEDCGATEGIEVSPLFEKRNPNNLAIDEQIVSLSKRITGRIAASNVIHPFTGEVIVKAGEEITENLAKAVERAECMISIDDEKLIGKIASAVVTHPKTNAVVIRPDREVTPFIIEKLRKARIEEIKIRPKVIVRSPIHCLTKLGICRQCYSRDLAIGRLVNLGEAAGVIAAQSIGEPGTQLTMRTFHIGGIALSKKVVLKSKVDGVVNLENVETVWKHGNATGEIEAVADDERLGSRIVLKGSLIVENKKLGRHDNYPLPSGSILKVKDGDEISAGDVLVEYNPNHIIAERNGTVTFRDVFLKDAVVVSENARLIVEPRDKPAAVVEYQIPQGAFLKIEEGDDVKAGDIMAEATVEQKAAIAGINGNCEFFNVKIKNNRVISENGLIFVIPDEKNRRVAVSYPLQKGIKDTKESVEAKKFGLQLSVKNGNEVKYNDELIVITSEIDGIARVSEKKGLIIIKSARNKEYIIPKSEGVKIDRSRKTVHWEAAKDGTVDILAPKASTNKTSDSRRVIVNQEVTHKIPTSCQLYTRDLKVPAGKTVHEGEKLTKPIHLKATINGIVRVINEFDEESEQYIRWIEIKNIHDVKLDSREEIGEKIVGRKLMSDAINRFTGEVIAERHSEDKPSIITETLIDRILLRSAHDGRVEFPETRVINIDASTNREDIIGLKPSKHPKFTKSIVVGAPITAEQADEIILAKGTKKEIEVENATVFVLKETEHDLTDSEKVKKSRFLGQVLTRDIKHKGKKFLDKGTMVDEKVFRMISENLDKIESIATLKTSEYRLPFGATPRYKTGDKVAVGSELVYPTQLFELVILEGEENFELPTDGELKVTNGERVKAGDDIIKPMEPVVSTIDGLVNYDTRYDKRTGEDMVEKIIVYTGFEYTIPAGIVLKIRKLQQVKRGDVLTEEVLYDDLDESSKKEYRIIRKEKSEKKYKITSEMDILTGDKEKVKKGQKIAVLRNFKYLSREVVTPQEDDGAIFYNTHYSPIIQDTLKIFHEGNEVRVSKDVDLKSENAVVELNGMKFTEDLTGRDGILIAPRKLVLDEQAARAIIAAADKLEHHIVHVVHPEVTVYYTTGEIFFKTMPGGEWTIEYASECDGVVKLLKRKTKEGKERTTIGEIVVQSGEAHQVLDGAELKVEDSIVPVKTKIPFHVKLSDKAMMHTVFNIQTGEIIVEKNEFTNKGICNRLQKQKGRLNRRTLRAVSKVGKGTILAKWGTSGQKTADIIQGLPRVQELFEIRKPKKEAFIVEDDGEVRISGSNIVIKKENGERKQYKTQFGSQALIVCDGEIIRAGDPISDGNISPKKLAKIAGISTAAKYLLDEVQQVYKSQGVTINDKHIEVILRQMMRKVRIKDPGDTNLLPQDLTHLNKFQEENDEATAKHLRCATGERILQGITQASLTTESFISAASFQETTRVLTRAAIESKIDTLRGLKENLIIGKLIPAGTGLRNHRRIEVTSPEDQERIQRELKLAEEGGQSEELPEITEAFVKDFVERHEAANLPAKSFSDHFFIEPMDDEVEGAKIDESDFFDDDVEEGESKGKKPADNEKD